MLTYSGLGGGGRGLIWAVITNLWGPSQGGSVGSESACHAGDTTATHCVATHCGYWGRQNVGCRPALGVTGPLSVTLCAH